MTFFVPIPEQMIEKLPVPDIHVGKDQVNVHVESPSLRTEKKTFRKLNSFFGG
jgi:hypothetical protein